MIHCTCREFLETRETSYNATFTRIDSYSSFFVVLKNFKGMERELANNLVMQ